MTYHSYIIFDTDKLLREISESNLKAYKKEFLSLLEQSKNVIVYSYSTLGLKTNSRFMLWLQANSVEELQDYLNTLMHSKLGDYVTITQTLLGIARPTQYSPADSKHMDTSRKGGKYLIIYPFTKTHAWYQLNYEQRRDLMKGHIEIGRNYPQISQILLYSYGVDDSEFIVSYETDDLADFQKLVMDLRSDKVRAYTLKDTPIFTCVYKEFKEVMEFI